MKDTRGKFIHEPVWLFLFTHPVDKTGKATEPESDCRIDLHPKGDAKKSDETFQTASARVV